MKPVNRLDRYIMRHIALPSSLALGVVAFLAVANEIRERIDDMPVELVTVGDLSRLSLFFLPSLVSYVVPITYLLGTLMTFGRLAEQGELTAMKAAGIPLKRVVAPVILVGALLSVASFAIQDRLQPWALDRAFALVYSELPQRVTLDKLPAGVMHEYEGWRVYFGSKDARDLTLHDIDIVRPEEGGGASFFHAESARLVHRADAYELRLTNGHFITANNARLSFESQQLAIPRPSVKVARGGRRTQTLAELIAGEKKLAAEYGKSQSQHAKHALRKQRSEIGERLSLSFACIAVAFLAAPLGARSRGQGRSYAFALGFVIILVYYVLQMLLEPRSVHALWEVILRAWIPNLLLLLTGLGLLWRVDRV